MRRHLSYANVMSTVAVVLALAGGSTAVAISAGKKGKVKIPKNSVTSKSIKNGAVTASDLTDIRIVRAASSSNFASARCAEGEKLIGGGGQGSPALSSLTPSGEPDPRGNFNEWTANAVAGSPNTTSIVQALCLSAISAPPGN